MSSRVEVLFDCRSRATIEEKVRRTACHPHGGVSFAGALSATKKAAAWKEKPAWQNFWEWCPGGLECFHRMLSLDTLIKITSVQHRSHNFSWKMENMIDMCEDLVFKGTEHARLYFASM